MSKGHGLRIFKKRRNDVPRGDIHIEGCTGVQVGDGTISNSVHGTVTGNVVQARDIKGNIDDNTTPEQTGSRPDATPYDTEP
jgi:hypothetical protein